MMTMETKLAGGEHDMTGLPRRAALTATMAALLPVKLAAQPHGRGRQQGGSAPSAGIALFTSIEIARIREYYASRPSIRAQRLPPGIARNLERGKPLPPGIAKRYAPNELIALLTARAGAEILVAGASILLVDRASRMIIDIVGNAILN